MLDLGPGERLKVNTFVRKNRDDLVERYRELNREELDFYRAVAEDSRADKISKSLRGGPKSRLKDVDMSFDLMKDMVSATLFSFHNTG